MLEPTHLFTLVEPDIAADSFRSPILQVQAVVNEMQAYARHQYRSHRYQCNRAGILIELAANHGTFVSAIQSLDSLQCDGIYIPRVAPQINNLTYAAAIRRVDSVIHSGRKTERHVVSALVVLRKQRILQQVGQRISETLGLQSQSTAHPAHGADDAIAWADYRIGVGIDRAGSTAQRASKNSVQASKLATRRVTEIEIAKPSPKPNASPRESSRLNSTDVAKKSSELAARDAIGQEKIDLTPQTRRRWTILVRFHCFVMNSQ
ncbi:MAG: hypothetical protein R3E77_14990 [Steroidobacteraceae bacterium]